MSVRVAVGVAVLLASSSAVAQTPSARALIDEGRALRRAGRDADAYARFVEANRLAPSAETVGQLGFSEHALSRWADASEHLHAALDAPTDAWVQANRRALEFSLHEVERHVGALQVQCATPDARLELDGRPAPTRWRSEPVRVSSGPVAMRLEAPGFTADVRTLTVAAGETVTTVCRLDPEAPHAPTAAVSPTPAVAPTPSETTRTVATEVRPGSWGQVIPTDRGSLQTTLGWVAAGGALTAGAGAVLGFVLRESAATRWNDDNRCLLVGLTRAQSCGADRDDVDRWHTVMIAAGAASGALLVTSVLLLATAHGPRPTRRAWSCAPAVAGGVCSFAF